MLDFNEPILADKARTDAIFYADDIRANDYCFGNLFIWHKKSKINIAFHEGFVLVRFKINEKPFYLYPAGSGNKADIIRQMATNAKSFGERLTLSCVTPAMQDELENLFPDKFQIIEDRANYDYIYNSEELINLTGRKFHSKRNHITRFKSIGNWIYEDITPENLEDCRKMNKAWCIENGCGKDNSLKEEYCAVQCALDNFKELGFIGGLIRLEGRVVAFTLGERLCSDTFDIHIEKAFSDVEGAYTVINNEFVTHNLSSFAYINREEDMGIEGLRKAKLSWNPAMILQKNIAALKDGAVL